MQDFYEDYLEDFGIKQTVKEWATDFFQEVTLDTHTYCLVENAWNQKRLLDKGITPTPNVPLIGLEDAAEE